MEELEARVVRLTEELAEAKRLLNEARNGATHMINQEKATTYVNMFTVAKDYVPDCD